MQTLVSDIDYGDKLMVKKTFSEVSPDDYDAVIVPGGAVGSGTLRGNEPLPRRSGGVLLEQARSV